MELLAELNLLVALNFILYVGGTVALILRRFGVAVTLFFCGMALAVFIAATGAGGGYIPSLFYETKEGDYETLFFFLAAVAVIIIVGICRRYNKLNRRQTYALLFVGFGAAGTAIALAIASRTSVQLPLMTAITYGAFMSFGLTGLTWIVAERH